MVLPGRRFVASDGLRCLSVSLLALRVPAILLHLCQRLGDLSDQITLWRLIETRLDIVPERLPRELAEFIEALKRVKITSGNDSANGNTVLLDTHTCFAPVDAVQRVAERAAGLG